MKFSYPDHQQRSVFTACVLEMYENDPEFQQKIILTDVASGARKTKDLL